MKDTIKDKAEGDVKQKAAGVKDTVMETAHNVKEAVKDTASSFDAKVAAATVKETLKSGAETVKNMTGIHNTEDLKNVATQAKNIIADKAGKIMDKAKEVTGIKDTTELKNAAKDMKNTIERDVKADINDIKQGVKGLGEEAEYNMEKTRQLIDEKIEAPASFTVFPPEQTPKDTPSVRVP